MNHRSLAGWLGVLLITSGCGRQTARCDTPSGTWSGVEYKVTRVAPADTVATNVDIQYCNTTATGKDVYLFAMHTPDGEVGVHHLSIASVMSCYPVRLRPGERATGHYVIDYNGAGSVGVEKWLVTEAAAFSDCRRARMMLNEPQTATP
jgi:hypothetical protein